MTTAPFLDKNNATVNIELPLPPGTAADAVSRPVAFSTEGKAQLGAIAETAPTTDIASSGLNGRLQRVAQRITSLIALLPTALGAGGGLKVDGSGTALPVSGTVTANAGTGNFSTIPGSSETKVTAATIGTGGVGYVGWLSTIANYLAGTLTVATHAVTQSGSWVIAAGSNLMGKVGIDQTTDGTTNKVAADLRVAGSAVATGSGANGATVIRTALATDSPGIITLGTAKTPPGGTTVLSSQLVADLFGQYETVAASATAQPLGATGATGDYLAYVTVFPGTAGCGVVTILDNATTIGTFAGGGTTALPSLVPFTIQIGLYSTSGAWKITTGANVTVVGVGAFT